jgi:hypothetical protein
MRIRNTIITSLSIIIFVCIISCNDDNSDPEPEGPYKFNIANVSKSDLFDVLVYNNGMVDKFVLGDTTVIIQPQITFQTPTIVNRQTNDTLYIIKRAGDIESGETTDVYGSFFRTCKLAFTKQEDGILYLTPYQYLIADSGQTTLSVLDSTSVSDGKDTVQLKNASLLKNDHLTKKEAYKLNKAEKELLMLQRYLENHKSGSF